VRAGIHSVIEGTRRGWTDEYRFLRADGAYAYILDRGYVLRDAHGRAVRMTGAMIDMTERKAAEEHQRLLTGELQHRIKNTLAMVQAIASQTFRRAPDVDAARGGLPAPDFGRPGARYPDAVELERGTHPRRGGGRAGGAS